MSTNKNIHSVTLKNCKLIDWLMLLNFLLVYWPYLGWYPVRLPVSCSRGRTSCSGSVPRHLSILPPASHQPRQTNPPSEEAGVVWSRGYFSGAVTLGRLRLQLVVHKTSKNEKKRKMSLNVRSSYVMLSIIYKSAPEHKFSSISSHSMWYFKKWKCRRVGNYIGTPINI